ncbi:excisionase family DNA-binding protein [Granulicella sp. 5B5]|jgi:excisionase family DNA binding protein|uniref:excisionase family DNA-binding protein n=1 Tax=Granulicella sp. 5B5 TaxID=1617967 RepID=UPI0015F4686A|nr:excisionase family DNA-binding protein [Granulicella sp. 5B5]QMV19988.1 excisionase family DNA-binding protein [Granulicella sp. 5B5]
MQRFPPSPTHHHRRLVRTRQAADYLCISEWKLRRLVQDGGLPFVQDGEGTPFLFDLRDLDAYIDRHKHTGIDLFAS